MTRREPTRATQPKAGYARPARLLHWVMAVIALGMIPVGFLMLNEELSRELRNSMFIAHKNLGSLMLVLIVLRLLYRWRRPPNLRPVALPWAQEMAARASHLGLYALLVIMPLSGYVRVRAGGFPIEALDAMGVPAFVPRSDALAEVAKTVHFYSGYAIAGLVVLHICAAAYHGLVRRDGIFSRMWPVFARNTG